MFPIEDSIINAPSNCTNKEEETSHERKECVLANGIIAQNKIAEEEKLAQNGDIEIPEKGKTAANDIRETNMEKEGSMENGIQEKGKSLEMEIDSTQNILRKYAKKYRFPICEKRENPETFVNDPKETSNGEKRECNRGNGESIMESECRIQMAKNSRNEIERNDEIANISEESIRENGKRSKKAGNKFKERGEITDLGNVSIKYSEEMLRKYAKKYRFPVSDEKLEPFSNDQKEIPNTVKGKNGISENGKIEKNSKNQIRDNLGKSLENARISEYEIRGNTNTANNLKTEILKNADDSVAGIPGVAKKYKFPDCDEEPDLGEIPPSKFSESEIPNTNSGSFAISKRKIKNVTNQFTTGASYDATNKAKMNSTLFRPMKTPYNNGQRIKLTNKNVNVNISIPKSKIWATDASYHSWTKAGMPLVKLNVRNLMGDGKIISERARNDEVLGGEAALISHQLDRLKVLRKSLGSSDYATISANGASEKDCLAIEPAEVKLKIHDFRFRHAEFSPTRGGKLESEELLLSLVEAENDGLKQLLADDSGLMYACYICEQRFDSEKNLKNHLNRESALLNYLCDSCNSVTTFTNRCLFTLHVNYHRKSHNAQYINKIDGFVGSSLKTTENQQPSGTRINGESCAKSENQNSRMSIKKEELRAKVENGESRVRNENGVSLATSKNGESYASSENGESRATSENGESSATSENGESCATSENGEFCATSDNGESRATSENEESRATSENGESCATSEDSESLETSASGELHPERENGESPAESKDGESCETSDNEELRASCQNGELHLIKDETSEKKVFTTVFTCHECKKTVKDLANHFSDGNEPRLELKCQICELHNQSRCAFSAHMRLHTKKAPFVCPECGVKLSNWQTLESHMKEVCHYAYKKIQFQCPHAECKVLKSHSGALLKHFKTSHLESIFGCSDCSFSNLDKNVVKEHMAKEHEDAELFAHSGVFVCSYCPENVIYGKSLSSHIDLHINDGKYVTYAYMCDSCTHVSIKQKVFAEHFKSCSTKSEGKPAVKFIEKNVTRSEVGKKCESCDRVVDENVINCYSCWKKNQGKVDAASKFGFPIGNARIEKSDFGGIIDSKKINEFDISSSKIFKNDVFERKSGLVTSDEFEIENAKKRIPKNYSNKKARNSIGGITKKEEEVPSNTERRSARNIKCKFCKVFINRGWQYMRAHLEKYHDSEFLYEGMTSEFDPNSAKNMAISKNFEDFETVETVHKYKPNLKPERAAKKRPHSEIYDDAPPKIPRKTDEVIPSNVTTRRSLPNLTKFSEKWFGKPIAVPLANEKLNKNLLKTPEKNPSYAQDDPITPPARVVIPKITLSDSKKISPNKTPRKSLSQTKKPSEKITSKLNASAEIQKNHTCVHCFVSFASLDEFRGHIFSHRDHKSNHQCLECGKTFKQFPSLEKHLLILHKVQRLNMYFEANRQKFWDDMHKQMKDKSDVGKTSKITETPKCDNIRSAEENQCDICFLKCSSKELLERHARSHGMAFVSRQSRKNKLAKNECC